MVEHAPEWRRSAKALRAVALVAAVGALVGALVVFDPAVTSGFPKCIFKSITGLHCSGCGAGRAAHRLLNGDFAGAFRMNPLLIAALPFLAALIIKPLIVRHRAVLWIAFVVVTAYGIIRNIPHHPFNLLAPH